MKLLFNLLFTCVSLILLIYLLLPAPAFPQKSTDSVQSIDEWDTETPFRRGYFTNKNRQEIINLYLSQMTHIGKIPLPTYRLNYPPEESQTIIRDQARSSYLEEIVHPFRESLFVNGHEPDKDVYEIWYRGVNYSSKVIIRYVPSNPLLRVTLFLTSAAFLYLLLLELTKSFKSLFKEWFLTKYGQYS